MTGGAGAVLRDTMDARSETLCDDRVESSPLWDLKLQPASRAWRAARATGKAFYEDFASVAVARAAANLQMGDYVAAISGLASLAGALPPRGIRGRTSPGTVDPGPTQQLPPPFYLALASDATCSELLATAAGARLAVRGRDPKVRLPAARALDEARAALQKAASGSAYRYFGLSLATFRRHTEAAAALEKALADPMIAASSCAEALAADAAAQRALAAEAGTLQVTLVPSGPWVEGVFGASRVVSINGDAPLGDLLGGVDEASRLRLIDSEGRALNREWTPAAACVYDGVTLLVAENDRRNLRQRRPDTYQTPAEAAQRRGASSTISGGEGCRRTRHTSSTRGTRQHCVSPPAPGRGAAATPAHPRQTSPQDQRHPGARRGRRSDYPGWRQTKTNVRPPPPPPSRSGTRT